MCYSILQSSPLSKKNPLTEIIHRKWHWLLLQPPYSHWNQLTYLHLHLLPVITELQLLSNLHQSPSHSSVNLDLKIIMPEVSCILCLPLPFPFLDLDFFFYKYHNYWWFRTKEMEDCRFNCIGCCCYCI